ncbi:uroporphyrinogen-III C-methyltransferase [Propionivibrio sp.]|uniref:uroporphyrinogen-III C-methyltransferase n=1 Tax=Propionivibrio sp. TaxID=2212460 RepID=UPI0026015222|nr:uroporphyrinogen-III C-methyltransferase [Propionivibrio sp.]MBK7355681.1 uroporphyrinogen-III C-methyltransferase [Propionivibrio sp.]MBK8400655.1 uroporphyrinogen-III C-methyltransferase [Propionivibrio sp.]MBK8745460.1 uroporphyrinogen-III C-methyltransferase [Propionivibrio sp.]MBK8893676.1 uroporphyrinogen-III C-methyltransferase [Propionivibrio sp.]MBL0207014.1 uroporphyrinogen-III C-methyltransferase [Propionivibrio sp.]
MNETVDQHPPRTEDSGSSVAEAAVPAAQVTDKTSYGGWKNPWLFIALIALGLAGWQWVETRMRLADTQQELARRLSESDTVAKESRALSRQAQEQFSVLQGKFGELEGKIAESQSQQAALETLYQEVARSRDEWALAEVEQSVTLAAQQLQLAGNVQGAVLALQTAEARLAGSGRPQFVGLRKVLGRDLDRLRALPQLDLTGTSAHLESLIAAVDTFPLAVAAHPPVEADEKTKAAAEMPAASISTQAFWRQLAFEFWSELRSLVRIQRFDRDEPILLAPGQEFFLRENLKLRLLNSRLALLAHEERIYRNELKQAQLWIARYFDPADKSVQAALAALKQLSSTEINSELPSLNESLSAVKNIKLGKERQ